MERERFIGRLLIIIYITLLVTFAGFFGIGGCGGGGETPVNPVQPPLVVSVDSFFSEFEGCCLSNLFKDAVSKVEVTVTFDDAMDPATINENTFYVTSADGVVEGSLMVDGATAVFVSTEKLRVNATYLVTITSKVADISGVKMASDYEQDFSIGLPYCDTFFNMELDPDFGTDGKVSFDNAGKVDIGNAVVIQDDGKVLVSGYSGDGANGHDADLLVIRLDTDGELDATFGVGGSVIVPCDSFWGIQWWAQQGMTLQSDGKILVGGDCQMKATTFRLNTDGTLDNSFGVGGRVEIAKNIAGGNWSAVFSLAMQPDGSGGEKVVIGGIANRIDSWNVEPVWVLARLNSDGSVDNTFGDQGAHPGVMIEDWGTLHDDGIRDLLILPDGKIIAYGNYDKFNGATLNTYFAAARFGADGVLDTTFGSGDADGIDGLVVVDFTGHDWAYPIALTHDGKLVGGAHVDCCWDTSDTGVFRLTSDGVVDDSFGGDGKVVVDMGGGYQNFGNAIVTLPNGALIVGGYANNGGGIVDQANPWKNDEFGFAMLDENGNLVAQFGTDGILRTDFYGEGDGINSMELWNVITDDDGELESFELIAAGTAVEPPDTKWDFAVAKYRSVPVELCSE